MYEIIISIMESAILILFVLYVFSFIDFDD